MAGNNYTLYCGTKMNAGIYFMYGGAKCWPEVCPLWQSQQSDINLPVQSTGNIYLRFAKFAQKTPCVHYSLRLKFILSIHSKNSLIFQQLLFLQHLQPTNIWKVIAVYKKPLMWKDYWQSVFGNLYLAILYSTFQKNETPDTNQKRKHISASRNRRAFKLGTWLKQVHKQNWVVIWSLGVSALVGSWVKMRSETVSLQEQRNRLQYHYDKVTKNVAALRKICGMTTCFLSKFENFTEWWYAGNFWNRIKCVLSHILLSTAKYQVLVSAVFCWLRDKMWLLRKLLHGEVWKSLELPKNFPEKRPTWLLSMRRNVLSSATLGPTQLYFLMFWLPTKLSGSSTETP